MPPSVRILTAAASTVVAFGAIVSAPPARADPATWPLNPTPVVVRAFDPPALPWLAGHRGADLRGSAGAVVRAPIPGTVTFAGQLAGRGVIVISHGQERTTYEPVTATVQLGAGVDSGSPIGILEAGGASHCQPAACLHWGRIRNSDEVYLDPLALLRPPPVRLFPLLDPAGSPVRLADPHNGVPLAPACTTTSSPWVCLLVRAP